VFKKIVLTLEDDIDIPKLIKFLKVIQEHTYYVKNIHIDYFESKEEEEVGIETQENIEMKKYI
jgi:hypothetical protein